MRWKLRKYPRSFNCHLSYKKICLINFGEIQNCCFWHILHSCVCKIWWFFPNGERKKKPVLVPIVKIIHRLECAWYTFLDHPKTLVFRVIKTKIIFKYLRARSTFTYSSGTGVTWPGHTMQSFWKDQYFTTSRRRWNASLSKQLYYGPC